MYSAFYSGLEAGSEVVVAACVSGAIADGQENAFCHESAINFADSQRAHARLFI